MSEHRRQHRRHGHHGNRQKSGLPPLPVGEVHFDPALKTAGEMVGLPAPPASLARLPRRQAPPEDGLGGVESIPA